MLFETKTIPALTIFELKEPFYEKLEAIFNQ